MKLWRNPRDGYFHIRQGQRRKSLGTKDSQVAALAFKEFEKLSLKDRLAYLEGLSRVTLSEFRDRYIASRGTRSKHTLRADLFAFGKLIAFAGDVLVSTLSREDVGRFHTSLTAAGLKKNSIAAIGRHLRAAFNEAIEWGILEKNPYRKAKLGRASLPAPRLVVGDVRKKLLAAADRVAMKERNTPSGKRDWQRWVRFKTLIEFALATGLRRIELSRLTWGDVREASVIVHGKGDRFREVPVTPSARALLGDPGKPDAYVFPWRDPNTITRMFKKVTRAAKIPDVTPHTLRHTTESQLAMAGVDLKGRMAMLGHSTQEMALHYTHVTAEQLREALGRIEREEGKKGPKGAYNISRK
jgi:integrase/recombinase XerC